MNTNNDFLMNLLLTHTPSGYERLCNVDKLRKYVNTNNVNVDNIWNQYFTKGYDGEDAMVVFISGHYDENAMQVVNITKEGMLHITNLGGIDRKTIEGSYVYVISDNWDEDTNTKKLIPGVIGKKPIHMESKDEREKIDEYDRILVDIGANKLEDVKELGIHVGSVIVFKKDVNLNFGTDEKKIVANALDDKIGVYVTTEAFNQIDEQYLIDHKIKLVLGWLTQEEVGLRGAIVAGKQLNPDISIDVDVTFDTSKCTAISKEKHGDIELGKGVVLEYGPHGQYVLMNDLKDIANKFAISYQEAVSKPGGNNCHAIQMNARNCATAHLGIPQRNMHTQVEMCHWDDVLNAIDLIKNYVETI